MRKSFFLSFNSFITFNTLANDSWTRQITSKLYEHDHEKWEWFFPDDVSFFTEFLNALFNNRLEHVHKNFIHSKTAKNLEFQNKGERERENRKKNFTELTIESKITSSTTWLTWLIDFFFILFFLWQNIWISPRYINKKNHLLKFCRVYFRCNSNVIKFDEN